MAQNIYRHLFAIPRLSHACPHLSCNHSHRHSKNNSFWWKSIRTPEAQHPVSGLRVSSLSSGLLNGRLDVDRDWVFQVVLFHGKEDLSQNQTPVNDAQSRHDDRDVEQAVEESLTLALVHDDFGRAGDRLRRQTQST